jgi:hypothetical protein
LFHKPSGRQMLRALQTSNLEKGRLETYVVAGTYAREQHLNCSVNATKEAITLTKKLDDGTVEQRVIGFSQDLPKKLQIAFRLVQGRNAPQAWRFYSQAGWDPGTPARDAEILSVYARTPEWKVVNRGWQLDDGPDAETLRKAKGGGFAFYNHESKFGALINYLPAEVGQIYLFWHPERPQLNMDVRTPAVTLNAGETLQLHYSIEYLAEPPK